eukprot:scaffold87522_cov75-Phaeocystis_antarctica.AAC.4
MKVTRSEETAALDLSISSLSSTSRSCHLAVFASSRSFSSAPLHTPPRAEPCCRASPSLRESVRAIMSCTASANSSSSSCSS